MRLKVDRVKVARLKLGGGGVEVCEDTVVRKTGMMKIYEGRIVTTELGNRLAI